MKKIITTLAGWYITMLTYLAPKKAAQVGLALFCKPFRAPIKDYHKKFLFSADRFSFHYDGIRIQAYRWGHGPKKILFLHGWQSHSFRWKAYIESLDREEYSLYAFDAPGHGLSGGNYLNVPFYGNVVVQLAETLGDLHALVGHSLGAFSALYTLHNKPSLKVNRLVLLAPPGEASDFVTVYKSMLRLSDKSMDLILDQFTNDFLTPITWFSTERFAAVVKIPGLIVHDEEDTETPYSNAVRIQAIWKQSALVTTCGLGHNLKSPDIVKAVTGFIKNGQVVHTIGSNTTQRGVEAI